MKERTERLLNLLTKAANTNSSKIRLQLLEEAEECAETEEQKIHVCHVIWFFFIANKKAQGKYHKTAKEFLLDCKWIAPIQTQEK